MKKQNNNSVTAKNQSLEVVIQMCEKPSVEDIRIKATPIGNWTIKGIDMLDGLAEEVGANVRMHIEMNPQFTLGDIEKLLEEIYNTDEDEYLRIDRVYYEIEELMEADEIEELMEAVELKIDEDALGIELCAMAHNVG